MAELSIKTSTRGPDPDWQDGDPISAYNDLRIHQIHSEHICLHWNLDDQTLKWQNRDLAEVCLAMQYQFRTERISKTEVVVLDQWTLESVVKSDVPNQYGHVIHLEVFFAKRHASIPHLVFGSPGAEIIYHGNSRYDDAYIWNQIESRTGYRKVDYGRMFLGDNVRQDHLCITTDDFSDEERKEITSSIYDDKVDPPVMLKKRKNEVDWENLPGMTGSNIDDITNPSVVVDIRDDFVFNTSQIVNAKSIAG